MSVLWVECQNCKYWWGNNMDQITYECYKCLNFNNFKPYIPKYVTTSTSTTPVEGAGATNYTKELKQC